MIFACALLSLITPRPQPRMVITPTSSSNTCEGDLILSSLLAALTAARAAERIAEITPLRPELMPAFNPAMALTPAERRVVAFRLAPTALRTAAPTDAPVALML